MNGVTAIIFILFVFSTTAALVYSWLKNKQHLLLCDVFRSEFGFLPGGIIIMQAGGIFLTFQKDLFFFFPLILRKGSFIIRDMNPEHYDFIRNLPKEITNWLKIKFLLLSIALFFFIAFIIIEQLIS